MVCKLLGFKGAADYTIESQFGNVPDKFAFLTLGLKIRSRGAMELQSLNFNVN